MELNKAWENDCKQVRQQLWFLHVELKCYI